VVRSEREKLVKQRMAQRAEIWQEFVSKADAEAQQDRLERARKRALRLMYVLRWTSSAVCRALSGTVFGVRGGRGA